MAQRVRKSSATSVEYIPSPPATSCRTQSSSELSLRTAASSECRANDDSSTVTRRSQSSNSMASNFCSTSEENMDQVFDEKNTVCSRMPVLSVDAIEPTTGIVVTTNVNITFPAMKDVKLRPYRLRLHGKEIWHA
ncbi:hypothetical protein DdX_16065 [Ditylenchus destructor]|uniref:Uncharacterized protein n=1 Tax=Ditylenchus destructor TaxID=166010 RepID=A0AAD4MPM5_9BILA|nr:hypothetical protein DdX_16065 [Ditylenchus destructor]